MRFVVESGDDVGATEGVHVLDPVEIGPSTFMHLSAVGTADVHGVTVHYTG